MHAKLVNMMRDVVAQHHKLARGIVWCRTCGRSQNVDVAECLQHGWPKCCGYTMTIDSPTERKG